MTLRRPRVHGHYQWRARWSLALRLRPGSRVRVPAAAPENDNAWRSPDLERYWRMYIGHERARVERYGGTMWSALG